MFPHLFIYLFSIFLVLVVRWKKSIVFPYNILASFSFFSFPVFFFSVFTSKTHICTYFCLLEFRLFIVWASFVTWKMVKNIFLAHYLVSCISCAFLCSIFFPSYFPTYKTENSIFLAYYFVFFSLSCVFFSLFLVARHMFTHTLCLLKNSSVFSYFISWKMKRNIFLTHYCVSVSPSSYSFFFLVYQQERETYFLLTLFLSFSFLSVSATDTNTLITVLPCFNSFFLFVLSFFLLLHLQCTSLQIKCNVV